MTRRTPESPPRRAPAEGPVPPDEKDADWGFEQGDDEKLIEPKLGIALVGVLLLAFGFVLYQKYNSLQPAPNAVMAGELKPAESGDKDPLIHPAGDGESAASPSPAEPMPTAALTGDQAGVPDPFSDRERTPDASTESAIDAASPFAAAEPTGHVDPFASSGGSAQTTVVSADGPTAPEPNPFADSGADEFHEPVQTTGVDQSGAGSFADGDPFFGGQVPPPQSEPTIALDESPHSESSTVPAPTQAWNLVQTEPEVASSDVSEPDPFAAEAEPQDGKADWSPAPAPTQEPDSFHSVEMAMPVPPQTAEPDPFSQSSLPNESEESVEPNPYGHAEVAHSPVEQSPPSDASEPGDWPALDGSGTEPDGSSTLTSSPELPVLAAPPTDEPANDDFVADEAPSDAPYPFGQSAGATHQSTTPVEPPALEFPPAPSGNQDGSDFSPAATPSVVVGERLVTIRRSDSLWSISQRVYGTARYVPALARYNRDRVPSPDKLKLGEHLLVPPPEVLEDQFPELFRRAGRRDTLVSPAGGTFASPSGSAQSALFLDESGQPLYRVGKSDTLSRIAQRFLGRGSRWKEILAMNADRLKSPETLKPGMVLRMPAEAAGVALAPDGPSIR